MNKSNANAKRNGYIGLGAMILLAGATVFGTDPLYKAIDNSVRPEIYVPGTYTGTARGYGGIVTADVTVSGKTIDSIVVNGEKETLLNMVLPGLTDSIIGKQSTEVDAVSGATLSSNAIKEAVDQALAKARGEKPEDKPETTKEASETSASLKDGTYTYESPEFDENGFKDQVSMTVKGNAITALTWDCIKEDGSKKSQLSMDGKYVMTEKGPKWHEQAEAVVGYVLEQQSLDGLVNEKGYTDSVSSVSINLMGFVNGVKDCLSQAAGEGESQASSLKEGTYTYESPKFDENGFKDQVSMTVKGNAITALTWDCIKEDGSKKSQLSMDGKYVMTEKGPKWHEQAEAVVGYVLDHQSLDGLVNEKGYTDSISSVSINLMGFVNGVKDCLTQAAGEGESQASALKEGTYTYESPKFDENGFKDQVSMTVKGNAITALTWDCIKEDGTQKSQLSMDGKYVMTEKGPKWHEQAEAVVGYVLDHQSLDGLVNEKGYTDSVSSVSINLMGFVNGVKDCLTQAAGEGESQTSALKEGTYTYESPKFDENGFKDQVSMTVKGNAITALTWDCIKEDGTKKSQLSMDGKYVMTEKGPKWHEQAEAVVGYVLDHQSLDGLVNEKGYTDSVSSVSINLMGFVNGVKDCLTQASKQ